jgi:signal transduction histidine kinase
VNLKFIPKLVVPEASRLQFRDFTLQIALTLAILLSLCGWIWLGYRQDLQSISARLSEQQAHVAKVSNSLSEHFGASLTLARSLADSDVFGVETGDMALDNLTLDVLLDDRDATRLANGNRIDTVLTGVEGPAAPYSTARGAPRPGRLHVWQLTRGLPLRFSGRPFASSRRALLTQALAGHREMIAAAELRSDGRVVLLEPYSLQLKMPSSILSAQFPGLLSRLQNFHTAASRNDTLLSVADGPFIAFASKISRRPGGNFLVLIYRARSFDIGETDFGLSLDGQMLLGKPFSPSDLNLYETTLELAGVSYSLAVKRTPSAEGSRTPARIVALMAMLFVALLVVNQQFARLLVLSDDLQARLAAARNSIEEKTKRMAHDFRNSAVGLRTLFTNIIVKIDPTETQRFDALINDINGYAEHLSLRLVGEALGYSDSQMVSQSYLRGAIDAVAKQASIGPEKKIPLTFDDSAGESEPFVRVPASDLSRILGNVMKNAVEACADSTEARIAINVRKREERILIDIFDNGRGVAEGDQQSIFDDNYTTKPGSGHGKGLPSARERARRYGGDVRLISSSRETGTVMQIELPADVTPPWFVNTITLSNRSVLVVVDDEDVAFEYWQKAIYGKFTKLNLTGVNAPELIHINSPTSLKNQPELIGRATQFLVDQHFENDAQTGLQLIEELQIQDRAILVTNLFEQTSVTDEAIAYGVKILPKTYILNARLPIELEGTE